MPEQNQMTPKATFIMGVLGGVAVISTIGFFVLLAKGSIGGNNSGSDSYVDARNTAPSPSPSVTPDRPEGNPSALPAVGKDDYILGDKNAKVTLIAYEDFECPFCLRHKPTIDRILTEYKGKVRFVCRHFPLSFHPQAQKAAEAYECAGELGGAEKAYLMHDKIFEANAAGAMGVDKWKSIAKDIKLNTSKFNDCLDTGKYASKISKQMSEGTVAGVSGTPATFVNGKLVSGAVPFEQFKSVIDGLL